MNVRIGVMAALALGLLAGSVPVSAQARQGPPSEARQRLERQVRERFEAMIVRELGIDEATSIRLRETVDGFMQERRGLMMRQADLRRRMRSSGTLLDEGEARTVLADLVTVQEAELDLLAREQEALLGVLSAPQLVRFYTLRETLGERARELRGGMPGPARRGGGMPPGPGR